MGEKYDLNDVTEFIYEFAKANPTFPTGLVFSDFRCLVEAEAESLQGAGH